MECQYLWERISKIARSLLGWRLWRVYGEDAGKILEKTCLKRKVILGIFMACLPIINIPGQVYLVNTFGKEFLK